MKRFMAIMLTTACTLAQPAHADAARYHRYWKEASDYAKAGFAEADKAVAVMKSDHGAYCFQISQVRNELERSTKLFMYAFEQIDADTTLTEDDLARLEPMIEDYKSIKEIQDRYVALQESRCLSGPSYSDTIPSAAYSADDGDGDGDDTWADEDEWDDYDASEDDNF